MESKFKSTHGLFIENRILQYFSFDREERALKYRDRVSKFGFIMLS